MNTYQVNLNNARFKIFKEVFDLLEIAFNENQIDFYVIGAIARDLNFAREEIGSRSTADIDLAVLITGEASYEKLKNYLVSKLGFKQIKENEIALISPKGYMVDLLPFGGLEVLEGKTVYNSTMIAHQPNGFKEVYDKGLQEISSEEKGNQKFKVASLSSIVLLKLIAFDDRPEFRAKDPKDIREIMDHFFELNEQTIFEYHNDVFDNEKLTLEDISSIVIGRELKTLLDLNSHLKKTTGSNAPNSC